MISVMYSVIRMYNIYTTLAFICCNKLKKQGHVRKDNMLKIYRYKTPDVFYTFLKKKN